MLGGFKRRKNKVEEHENGEGVAAKEEEKKRQKKKRKKKNQQPKSRRTSGAHLSHPPTTASREEGIFEGAIMTGQQQRGPDRWWSRSYLFDWGALVVLAVILLVVWAAVEPRTRFIVSGNPQLSYPYTVKEIVPVWLLVVLTIIVPAFIMVVWLLFLLLWSKTVTKRRFWHEIHNAALAFCLCVVISQLVTEVVKRGVGRYRPDYFSRSSAQEGDGRVSWPSGHASLSFACLTFLSLWLAGRTKLVHTKFSVVLLAILCLSPMALSLFIAATRVVDYRHHPSDVEFGMTIGVWVALLCYIVLFHSLLDPELCGKPRNRVSEELSDSLETARGDS